MSHIDVNGGLAAELLSAYSNGEMLAAPPSLSHPGFDLAAAYAVEAQLTRLRRESGRTTVGPKVGYASKALWRRLKLDTLVWARMYDDTVKYAENGAASLSLAGMCSPRIEPEIVFKKNSLGSPALTLGELAAAIARQPGAEPLAAGESISSGSLTASHPVAGGQRWRFEVEGLSCCTTEPGPPTRQPRWGGQNRAAAITVTFAL